MNTASKQTLHTIEEIVKPVPIGTNLGLLQLIWALIQGQFLPARGAVHTALSLSGFEPAEIRHSWQALRYGVWHISELLLRFQQIVETEGSWESHQYEGYKPVAVDLTAIWRPRLQGWTQKLYRQLTRKAFVGVGFGLIARVGHIGGHRVPLLREIVRGDRHETNEEGLKSRTLKQCVKRLKEGETLIHDAGVTLEQVHQAKVPRFVIRLPKNCTGRRNWPRPYKGVGRYPTKGDIVRPLERVFKGKPLTATAADLETGFELDGRSITAQAWHHLVRAELNASPDNDLFSIWVIDDPLFENDVIVFGTNLPETVSPATVYQLYIDRWPVEQIPLVAKQLLGCHRQFVFSTTSCWRLGELAFFVANLLTWLALILPAYPSGFWDRRPKKRLVGFVDSWPRSIIQKSPLNMTEFVEKHRSAAIYLRAYWRIDAQRMARPSFSLEIHPYC